jgi:alkylhydroperoxidase family enzyme
MSRVKYVAADTSEPSELIAAIRARRGGILNEADRMVLNAPVFAKSWNELATTVRSKLGVSPKLRELAICGVGVLNGADYEVDQHTPAFLSAGGTHEQLSALRDVHKCSTNLALFDEAERATIQLTIEMTRNIAVEDGTFERVRAIIPTSEQLVELIGVISFYNMVSRFLIALHVEPENR